MEHRSQPAQQPVYLKLVDSDPERIHLEILSGIVTAEKTDLCQAVVDVLQGKQSLTRTQLRDELRVKNERLGEVLTHLEEEGRIVREPNGWRLKACG
jgi:transcription initiation factor IIE alpha subunit